jgi:hypothetical protein
MSANTLPVFALTPKVEAILATTANTGYDGSGTLETLVTAAINGTKITWIKAKTVGASSAANMLRMFITDTNGDNPRLFDELVLSHQASPGSTVKTSESIVSYSDLQLKAGQLLKVSVHLGDDVIVIASIGDF